MGNSECRITSYLATALSVFRRLVEDYALLSCLRSLAGRCGLHGINALCQKHNTGRRTGDMWFRAIARQTIHAREAQKGWGPGGDIGSNDLQHGQSRVYTCREQIQRAINVVASPEELKNKLKLGKPRNACVHHVRETR